MHDLSNSKREPFFFQRIAHSLPPAEKKASNPGYLKKSGKERKTQTTLSIKAMPMGKKRTCSHKATPSSTLRESIDNIEMHCTYTSSEAIEGKRNTHIEVDKTGRLQNTLMIIEEIRCSRDKAAPKDKSQDEEDLRIPAEGKREHADRGGLV